MPAPTEPNRARMRTLRLTRHIKLYQPWARVVCEGAIPVLLRTYPTHIRGWVGVISAAKFDNRTIVTPSGTVTDFPLSSVIGAIRIDEVDPIPRGTPIRFVLAARFGRTLASFYPNHYIPPATSQVYMWVLGAAALATHPITPTAKTSRRWSQFSCTLRGPDIV